MLNTAQESARLAREMANVRHRKVRKIRDRLNSGKYRVKNNQVAKALWVSLAS
jgi:anti-sigma28 factor (negative regulator of flagellin synthesis)